MDAADVDDDDDGGVMDMGFGSSISVVFDEVVACVRCEDDEAVLLFGPGGIAGEADEVEDLFLRLFLPVLL